MLLKTRSVVLRLRARFNSFLKSIISFNIWIPWRQKMLQPSSGSSLQTPTHPGDIDYSVQPLYLLIPRCIQFMQSPSKLSFSGVWTWFCQAWGLCQNKVNFSEEYLSVHFFMFFLASQFSSTFHRCSLLLYQRWGDPVFSPVVRFWVVQSHRTSVREGIASRKGRRGGGSD